MASGDDQTGCLPIAWPILPVAEPARFLLKLAGRALAGAIGNTDPFDTSGVRCDLVLGGIKAGIGGDQPRYASKLRLVGGDSRDEQVCIVGSLSIDLLVDDDLILRFL
jgi:hypothetical protein